MEDEKMIVCKECGRELQSDEFKMTRWGKRASVCNECAAKKMKESKAAKKVAVERNRRELRLKDFTPRELMEELAFRGYEGKLTFTRVETIDITNF